VNWLVLLWAIGVLLAMAPLVVGHFRVWRTARRAALADDADGLLGTLCNEMGIRRPPALLIFPGPVMPLTFGLLKPKILIPANSMTWTALRRRAVLIHELAHVERRDTITQMFAGLATALWWFQPFCWMNRLSLRRESERACDEMVLAQGVRPSEYAAELLDIAQSFSKAPRWPAAAISMARRGELEERLYAILDSQPSRKARHYWLGSMLALASLTASASAITFQTGGSDMKRTLLSGLLSSAGLTAATIGGSLFDPSGAAIPDAKALLYNPDTAAKQETITAADGKFVFDNLSPGQYVLRVEKPGFAALFREFKVDADSKVERGLVLKVGSIHESVDVQSKGTPAAAQQPSNPQQVRIGGAVQESKLISKANPIYPASAKAAGIQGIVSLDMVISKDGTPLDIQVVSSPNDDLTQSSLEAVRQWRYSPTLLNGQPVEVVTDVVVNYTLSK
jgi:TonB family protein